MNDQPQPAPTSVFAVSGWFDIASSVEVANGRPIFRMRIKGLDPDDPDKEAEALIPLEPAALNAPRMVMVAAILRNVASMMVEESRKGRRIILPGSP